MHRATSRKNFWRSPSSTPSIDKALCLCAVNGRIMPDILVWFAKGNHFIAQSSSVIDGKRIAHDLVVKLTSIHFWAYVKDLPLIPAIPVPEKVRRRPNQIINAPHA